MTTIAEVEVLRFDLRHLCNLRIIPLEFVKT